MANQHSRSMPPKETGKMISRHTPRPRLALLALLFAAGVARAEFPPIFLDNFRDRVETERLIEAASRFPPARRVPFISACLLGRKYHPETKERIKKQKTQPPEKKEAENTQPLPVETLRTSLTFLDCMTYVEHVLALASSERPDYGCSFLPRLVDIMFDANGNPLVNHLRNHFTSQWGDVNERKGYLVNVARGHPAAVSRKVVLNQVGKNRTFYVEDRFMIARAPQTYHYFPTKAVLEGRVPLESGDVVAMVCGKEGLDVLHMGFFIENHGKRILRHASSAKNKVMDQSLDDYLREKSHILGIMVLRPVLAAPKPASYRFLAREK